MRHQHLLSIFCFFIATQLFAQSQFIHVDQFGYLPNASKVAVLSNPQQGYNANLSYTAPATLAVRNAQNDAVVFSGSPTVWNGGATHATSGDQGWWFDFSSLETEGDYYIYDADSGERSAVFTISPSVYAHVLKDAGRMFFYNRCNYEKAAPYAETGWTDGMNFRNNLQDANCRYYLDADNAALERELMGGWFDAGDYNKYVTFAEGAVHDLLWAYREYPQAFTDAWNIPESGNGVPDILDEIKWETDWLQKMDNDNGSVIIKMGSISYAENEEAPPSANTDRRYYGKICTSASIAFAGMIAHAAVVYQDIPAFASEVNSMTTAAENAYDYFMNVYAGNDNNLETDCDDGTIKAGDADRNVVEQKHAALMAAIHLFDLTGKTKYNDYITANIFDAEPVNNYWWGPYTNDLNTALLHYTTLANRDQNTADLILERLRNPLQNNIDFFGFNTDDLYRAFVPEWAYHWGSNLPKAGFATQNLLSVRYDLLSANNASYQQKASEQLHYFHGVNPQGTVYLSNMNGRGAERSADEIYHTWFNNGTDWDNAQTSLYGPAPGYVTGGANKDFSVGSISPPSGQPAQKSYLDWNTGFPEASWEITEPAIYYQAAYIRLLASQVEDASVVLPVTYLEPLRATLRQQQVILDWKIADEINAEGYEIQHQTESQPWRPLGKLTAAGLKKYQFVHPDLTEGINYYRLKQIDKDGQVNYSNIVSITFKDIYAKIKITNPIQSNQLTISGLPQPVKIRLSDLQGQLLTVLQTGEGQFNYNMEYLPQGTYVVEIFTNDNRLVRIARVIRN